MSTKRPIDKQGKEDERKRLLSEVSRRKLPFLMPDHADFNLLMKEKYVNFAHKPSTCVPQILQKELAWALDILKYHGYFYRDWVNVKGQTVQTPVSRTLVGEPGTTYKYLGLRLFTVPWSYGERQPENEVEIACGCLRRLNEHYKQIARGLLLERRNQTTETKDSSIPSEERPNFRPNLDSSDHRERRKGERTHSLTIDEGTDFNVVLINYMDPEDPELRLKPEPYYGMGPLAVSWHMDSNLVTGSTVAVYNHTCSSDEESTGSCEDWMVGLKVSWDIETPGVAIPLRPGESYFMLDDLNDTHQHCVVAGSQPRFSSTHRVADCSQGTLSYIQQRCKEALSNLNQQEDAEYHLKSFDASCLDLTETVHNEVEFEWLRQFWMQGSRHATERNSWIPAMEELEADWGRMEHMTKVALDEAKRQGSVDGASIAKALLPHLQDRQRMRQECLNKFPANLLDTMLSDHLPIHRPKWEDISSMRPLPFDLSEVIAEMRLLCMKRKREKCVSVSDSPDD